MSSSANAALQALRSAVLDKEHDTSNMNVLLPGVSVHRHNGDAVQMPSIQSPFLYVVLDGSLTLHQHDGIRQIGPGHFVVSEIDTPAHGYIAERPLVALLIEFTLDEVASVLLEFDDGLPGTVFIGNGDPGQDLGIDERLLDSVGRLVGLHENPDDVDFMARHLKREVIYRLVTGAQGRAIVSAVTNLQDAAEMYYVNAWIKRNYKRAFTVEALARQSDMSPSAFHRKFKNAVQMGPLQCQKQLRLTEARRLLLVGTMSVTDVAVHVGYESASQFSREYRREFGKPPRQDIASLQERLHHLADKPGRQNN
ncbi:helix-turn-helix transcriptional regulator [Mycolicibacterium conceptionense]|uniref:helix-turn-helix transcriptional regulator n=1 Tax=Mycolicibacterium conceptionense TaxID=451644 RepID=UPI00096E4697|nr:AraC family transcriptional regulator [Mycolicibacterium conceptionense]OMB87428.1 hypothetical protein A5743_23995 [Mycolicibacterium conceptionense]